MDIKKFEKATKILEQIKLLDSQIIEIDKFAMMVANGETKSSFQLICEDLEKKEQDDEKVEFDSDGSLIKGAGLEYKSMFELFMPRFKTTNPKKDNEVVLKNELSVNVVMSILGILLYDKRNQREILIQNIKNLGVNI